MVEQQSGVIQGLIAARERLAKQGLTTPRLEVVVGHVAVNLLTNIQDDLVRLPVKTLYTDRACWPPNIVTTASIKPNVEAKATKKVFALAVEASDAMDDLLYRSTHWYTLRVAA